MGCLMFDRESSTGRGATKTVFDLSEGPFPHGFYLLLPCFNQWAG